ncbi:hypothetical protein [Streptomyces sp. HYC2]|uniref:hypothetical protein n=1 Tax=Streptomyces sp. HYC2 TaxID=2955207 RepID=UPI00247FA5F0|nr:hypothetical protein [Streptomyces sp. HYC2]
MADHEDEIMEALAFGISRVYSLLVEVCGLLPVRIGLPTDQHVPADAAIPAIQRAAELAKEQPMGETQEAQLFTGCIHLLAAIDLYALCAMRHRETRAEGCGANLVYAEQALADLARWLVINEPG